MTLYVQKHLYYHTWNNTAKPVCFYVFTHCEFGCNYKVLHMWNQFSHRNTIYLHTLAAICTVYNIAPHSSFFFSVAVP